jgi:hypothetical protein
LREPLETFAQRAGLLVAPRFGLRALEAIGFDDFAVAMFTGTGIQLSHSWQDQCKRYASSRAADGRASTNAHWLV